MNNKPNPKIFFFFNPQKNTTPPLLIFPFVAIALKLNIVKNVVVMQTNTISDESLIPLSPVISGTLINSKTPSIFYITGKKTPLRVPYLY